MIAGRANDGDRSFDPFRPASLNLGAVSYLASLGVLNYDQEKEAFALSDEGAARVAANRIVVLAVVRARSRDVSVQKIIGILSKNTASYAHVQTGVF